MSVWNAFVAILSSTWDAFFLAAPFVLFGLLLAALLQVLVPRARLARWMGGGGLAAAGRAALLGIPLPICSCGIVPIAIALRRRGASRPAILSFLITTPESSADAVVLTWGLMGPLMAVARLVAALATALTAAVLVIAGFAPEESAAERDAPALDSAAPAAHAHAAGEPAAAHAHAHVHAAEEDDTYIGWRVLWRATRTAFARVRLPVAPETAGPAPAADLSPALGQEPAADQPPAVGQPAAAAQPPAAAPPELGALLRAAARGPFLELVDDVVFWLVIGLFAAGTIEALVPPGLAAATAGGGLAAMLLLLLLAVPMYVCASASTPIAAALVAKGVSPGAALVFLLAGPATNAATVTLVARHFGARFLRIYLASVVMVAIACGLALDGMAAALGWSISGQLASQAEGVPAFFELICALALLALIAWRLWAGAARQGLGELRSNLHDLRRWLSAMPAAARLARGWPALRRRLPAAAAGVALAAYLLSGVAIVPAGYQGFELRYGRAMRRTLGPGLHWLPPRPFARLETWHIAYPRLAGVGFHVDLALLAKRHELLRNADPAQWHSPVAAMSTDTREAAYLVGDENLLEMSFSVHYVLTDAFAFLYRMDREHDLVALCGQAAAREKVAAAALDGLLTSGRGRLETALAAETQRRLDRLGAGVRITSVHIVDLHPPQDAVFAFRDVSSAREDRDRRILAALAESEKEVPQARGNASLTVRGAQATADAARTEAAGRADAFVARADAFTTHRDILHDLLWLEAEEKVLPGRRKFIVPPGTAGRHIVLWPDQPGEAATLPLPDQGER